MFSRSGYPFLTFLLSYYVWVTSKIQTQSLVCHQWSHICFTGSWSGFSRSTVLASSVFLSPLDSLPSKTKCSKMWRFLCFREKIWKRGKIMKFLTRVKMTSPCQVVTSYQESWSVYNACHNIQIIRFVYITPHSIELSRYTCSPPNLLWEYYILYRLYIDIHTMQACKSKKQFLIKTKEHT